MTGKTYLIPLPWPPAALSPNARGHWSAKARAAKKYRGDARLMAQALGCRALPVKSLDIEVTFCPPDNRRRDQDNMIASIKAGLDGIADAAGVDDSNFRLAFEWGDPAPTQGGTVLVKVSQPDDWQQIGDIARDMVKGVVT